MQTSYTAIVQKRVKFRHPVLDGRGKLVFLDSQGKPIPRNEAGALTADGGTQKFEEIETDTTANLLTDDAGNVVEAGTSEALLRKVKEHFEEDLDTTVLHVTVRKTETVQEVSGEALVAVK